MLTRLLAEANRWVMVFTHGYFMKGVELRLAESDASVDAVLMARFRDARRQGTPRNCEWLRLELQT